MLEWFDFEGNVQFFKSAESARCMLLDTMGYWGLLFAGLSACFCAEAQDLSEKSRPFSADWDRTFTFSATAMLVVLIHILAGCDMPF